MGIEDEADRTLFIRNLDTRVTEELLFELFLQAGPLVRTKIPKDLDGKQKTFGFAVYKHEVSVPYAMHLLNGTSLYGKTIQVQFRTGSSHSSPGNSQNSSPANTPNPHGQRTPVQFGSPPYTPPHQMQRSFSSPDNLPKHVMRNNMWQLHMQQLEQLNGTFSKSVQRQSPAGGHSGRGDSRQQDGNHYRHHPSQMNSGGRSQRHGDEHGSGRHQQHGHSRENYYQQNDRSGGNRHHDSRGGNRHYEEWPGNRGHREHDNRRRY
ncbi:hypothetical protein CRENBAI_020376 [Crenichthys baileyi]|uniref:RRM domain-containing protein n=1 Tax=Crenichthys baileyi TaxID=28760 RepID=A0AAV9QTQ0_9TELE